MRYIKRLFRGYSDNLCSGASTLVPCIGVVIHAPCPRIPVHQTNISHLCMFMSTVLERFEACRGSGSTDRSMRLTALQVLLGVSVTSNWANGMRTEQSASGWTPCTAP